MRTTIPRYLLALILAFTVSACGEEVIITLFVDSDQKISGLEWTFTGALGDNTQFGTAIALVVGAFLILINAALAEPIMLLGLGGLMYTSTNSLGWSLAAPERSPYVWPMAAGLIGGIISAAVLILF